MYLEINKKIAKLKDHCRPITNGYTDDICSIVESIWEEKESFMFSYDDHGVKRLIYYASDEETLEKLLCKAGNEKGKREYVVEFLSRNVNENKEVFERAGYVGLARMMRMSTSDCGNVFDHVSMSESKIDSMGKQAGITDTEVINRKLWSVFDTRISHLVSDDELKEMIRKGEVYIHKGKMGNVDAILQTHMQPRKLYINQVFNGAEKRVIHDMLQRRIREYIQAGGKYMYAWVEKDNIASLKFHQKYGMRHDGMWDLVYASGKNNVERK
ncbi:hypothetical protein EBB54_27640 [Schaedlerella arabinosiphila]|jgi:hypothetical protein|uniref:N-acetyltransferase domain-containing protein n=2 Tax=Schaedlerella arabinosiphila TaxID=2044587 RepID=A0A426DPR4_9FIRM|nr:hypothetical protein EBB54_27640 [Schaedlerella arabinosiphila]